MKLKWYRLKNKGSSALLLALMVSGTSLGVIYYTQKSAGQFLSGISQQMEEWEKHLVSRSAGVLGGYIVANNLIMCRESGWPDKRSKCKWSRISGMESPQSFNLKNERDSAEGLIYEGEYEIDGHAKAYQLTFELVPFDEERNAVGSLIGAIPKYVCRHSETNSLMDGVCPDYESASDPSNQKCKTGDPLRDIPKSRCEYIKAVDGDRHIVLIKVEVPWTDPVTGENRTHTALSGIRRPFALISFESVRTGQRCSQGCDVGKVAHFAPECRSDGETEGVLSGIGSQAIKIKNDGPGILYRLSIMKVIETIQTQDRKLAVTPDIIALSDKEVLRPGKALTFEWFSECPRSVKTVVQQRTSYYRSGVDFTVRNETAPFQKVFHAFQYSTDPIGVCYTPEHIKGRPLPAILGDVSSNFLYNSKSDRIDNGQCIGRRNNCVSGGKTGRCRYVDIEPARGLSQVLSEDSIISEMVKVTVVTETTKVRPPRPPAPPVDGDGGDGGDGADSSNN